MSVARRFPSALVQISPGMTHPPSRLCQSDLRHGVLCKFQASTILAALPHRAASYPLPVRQASALPSASFRFAVTHDTLAVQLTLPLAGRVEDFHLQVSAPCRAHQKKAHAFAWASHAWYNPQAFAAINFSYLACNCSLVSTCAGSCGMQSTGQTSTHCGVS